MKKTILIGLMLALSSPGVFARNVVSQDFGHASKDANNRVSCPGTDTQCWTLYDDGTADIWYNGDLHPGTWTVVYPPEPEPQVPVPMHEIPENLDGTGYTAEVFCPTCP